MGSVGGYKAGSLDDFDIKGRTESLNNALAKLESNIDNISENTIQNRLKKLRDLENYELSRLDEYMNATPEPDIMSVDQPKEYDELQTGIVRLKDRIRKLRKKKLTIQ